MRFRMFPKLLEALPAGVTTTDGSWLALEKIHGAHFVVGIDRTGNAWFGKRKDWLDESEAFFGWQIVRNVLAGAAAGVRDELRRTGDASRDDDVVLYGELFGGGYPHSEVAAVRALTPVQTGIWYAPTSTMPSLLFW